jgi:hypothetical protein
MNPFFLSPDDQITSWKTLREEIKSLDEAAALQKVADYWAAAPLLKLAYDPEDCSGWPSPWEMIHANDWCANSVAIGMEFTLRLAGWEPSRLTLMFLRDYDISDQRMVLKIDESVVLNYSVGEVNEYPNTNHDVLVAFKNDGKRYFAVAK